MICFYNHQRNSIKTISSQSLVLNQHLDIYSSSHQPPQLPSSSVIPLQISQMHIKHYFPASTLSCFLFKCSWYTFTKSKHQTRHHNHQHQHCIRQKHLNQQCDCRQVVTAFFSFSYCSALLSWIITLHFQSQRTIFIAFLLTFFTALKAGFL